MPLTLRIITPERVVFDELNIDSITLPGALGELTILPRHAPLMTELRPGPVVFRRSGEEVDLALSGGFLEVREDAVTVLADTAERSDEIDQARAEEARRRAQELMANREGQVDFARALAALERAQARIRVVERRRRRGGGVPRPPEQQRTNQ
ncbi:MAG TPA: F0F1 ATP synthase subunit epsilon [Dehalococcoidia bacterium]|jgi:F-type H+-transporting ATPase subunit epsilon|nr:F0F1 ATP synthase subunit epsilon [Dehalococcoidia bacterium]